jgi:hypothetical protein
LSSARACGEWVGLRMGGELKLTGEPRRSVRVQVASKVQGQNNQYHHTYSDGVIAPVLTVWPDWKAPYKRYNNHYRENK